MKDIFLILNFIILLISLLILFYDKIKLLINKRKINHNNKFKLNFLGKYYKYKDRKYRCINATKIKTNKQTSIFLILKGQNQQIIEVNLNELEEIKEEQ